MKAKYCVKLLCGVPRGRECFSQLCNEVFLPIRQDDRRNAKRGLKRLLKKMARCGSAIIRTVASPSFPKIIDRFRIERNENPYSTVPIAPAFGRRIEEDAKSCPDGESVFGANSIKVVDHEKNPTFLAAQSFNGTFRSECLNIHWFMDLKEARQLIEAWRQEYNESRPHASLDDRTPSEFASQIAARRDLAAT